MNTNITNITRLLPVILLTACGLDSQMVLEGETGLDETSLADEDNNEDADRPFDGADDNNPQNDAQDDDSAEDEPQGDEDDVELEDEQTDDEPQDPQDDDIVDEADSSPADGLYAGTDSFWMDIVVRVEGDDDDAEDTCIGDFEIDVDSAGVPQVLGSGTCFHQGTANVWTYELEGELSTETIWTGELRLTFNGKELFVPLTGSIDEGFFSADFMHTWAYLSGIEIDIDGGFDVAAEG